MFTRSSSGWAQLDQVRKYYEEKGGSAGVHNCEQSSAVAVAAGVHSCEQSPADAAAAIVATAVAATAGNRDAGFSRC